MRTATLTLLAVASAASVGQNGTVAPVAAGQGGKPADAGKPDPEWNKDPEWFDRTQWSKNTLGPLMMSEEERKRHEFPEPPPVRGQPRPTAFPDVKPVGPKEVMAFAARSLAFRNFRSGGSDSSTCRFHRAANAITSFGPTGLTSGNAVGRG